MVSDKPGKTTGRVGREGRRTGRPVGKDAGTAGWGKYWRSELGRMSESGMERMPEKQTAEEEKENDGYHK